MHDYDWYYNLKKGEESDELSEVNDVSKMYEKLAEKIATGLYIRLFDEIYAFSHEEESVFYGNYPTIWEQLKYDVGHGDFLNKDQLAAKCSELLDRYTLTEIWLIWIYACSHSMNHSVYDELPDFMGCIDDITDVLLADLYRSAEDEVHCLCSYRKKSLVAV